MDNEYLNQMRILFHGLRPETVKAEMFVNSTYKILNTKKSKRKISTKYSLGKFFFKTTNYNKLSGIPHNRNMY